MNKNVFYLLAILAFVFSSCASPLYYQVYKVSPSETVHNTGDKLVYEDENCVISYNLWDDGGNIGFLITNKNDDNLYLDLSESFYILNGIAYDYFKNRSISYGTGYSKTTSKLTKSSFGTKNSTSFQNYLGIGLFNTYTASSVTLGNQNSQNLSIFNAIGEVSSETTTILKNEQSIICIPSKSSKYIMEYNVTKNIYRDCDLLIFPSRKQTVQKNFTMDDSPVQFSNRLAYYIGESNELIHIENSFYVSEISNYPEKNIIEEKTNEFCGEKQSTIPIKYFKNAAPDKFYISYQKSFMKIKH